MNLTKLFEIQKVLDAAINNKKGLEGRDMLPEKILALQVELGECANEWRGFKFWSEDREPRTHHVEAGMTYGTFRNLLLEEFVDCLHFILSIGLEIKADRIDYFETMKIHDRFGIDYRESNLTKQFSLVFYFVSELESMNGSDEYSAILLSFVRLGEMLDFTWEQIEAAYMEKNAINHSRQDTGY